MKITFLGAAGTVTGSKYLVEAGNRRILVDCGLFQGQHAWTDKNWDAPIIEPRSIDLVLLTHSHIDHVGMLPRFRRLGLRCPVLCTAATQQLAKVMLLDSAHLQEEEAEYRAQRGKSRHSPPLPLYTSADAEAALQLLRPVQCNKRLEVLPGIFAQWSRMGHIIGACSIRLELEGRVINFSGDIGRYKVPILKDPEPVQFGDLLLIESTYGDRVHPLEQPQVVLGRLINETVKRKGILLIPTFAVGRTQTLLYYLRELKEQHLIPDIPVVIDSPMAVDATSIYANNPADYDEDALKIIRDGRHPFAVSKLAFVRDRQASIKLNSVDEPMVLMAASGMLSGGRILHHLKNRIGDPRNTLVFVGFQPPGGKGAWILEGNSTVRLFREDFPVRAQIAEISGFSAHADKEELLTWCRSCSGKPGKVAVVHGEPRVAEGFAGTLRQELGFDTFVPQHQDSYEF